MHTVILTKSWLFLSLVLLINVRCSEAVRTDPNDTTFWYRLVEVVKQHGGFVHPAIEPALMENGYGIKIQASSDIPQNLDVIRVPATLTITTTDIYNTFPAFVKHNGTLSDIYVHAIYLGYLRATNNSHIYMTSAPANCVNGIYFPYSAKRTVDKRAQIFFQDLQTQAESVWTDVKQLIKDGSLDPENKGLHLVDRKHFLWGYCIYSSRSFTSHDGLGVNIPVGDMLNHSPEYNTLWDYEKKTSTWVWTANRDISAGDEVFDSYGSDRENIDMVFSYGLVNTDNYFEKGYILRKYPSDPTLKHIIDDIIKPIHSDWAEYSLLGFSEKELIIFRLLELPPDQLTSYNIGKIVSGVIIRPLEEKVWSYAFTKCTEELNTILGSKDEDLILYDQLVGSINKNHRRLDTAKAMIVSYRLARRDFIQNMCNQFYQNMRLQANFENLN